VLHSRLDSDNRLEREMVNIPGVNLIWIDKRTYNRMEDIGSYAASHLIFWLEGLGKGYHDIQVTGFTIHTHSITL